MSHRKFEAPRHGSLGYLPRKEPQSTKERSENFLEMTQLKSVI